MKRRYVRSSVRGVVAVALLISACATAQTFSDIKPSPQQTEWQDLEFGVILHFGTNTFLNREWGDGTADPKVFDPASLDADQWMRAIKAAGATYVVMVAKHHDGFCLWPTAQTDYSVKASPWRGGRGDLVGEVARAARANGLRFGIYLSPWDRHDPRYKDRQEYDRYYLAELEELSQNYGELTEFWLDGAGSAGRVYDFAKIIETLRVYQPNTIVFADTELFQYADARWVGNEAGKIDYENWNVIDRHGFLRWRPIEADTPLRKLHWFWHPRDEDSLRSLDDLIESYEASVGQGGQWMLGVAPDNRGLIPDSDVTRLRELGETLHARYANNLAKHHVPADNNSANALDGDPKTFWSAPDGSRAATLEMKFTRPVTFNQSLIMEWLVDGQNIREYRLEVWREGAWQTVVVGHAIGHKKNDHFPEVTSRRVRLNILSSSGIARIRELQLFKQEDHDGARKTTLNKKERPERVGKSPGS